MLCIVKDIKRCAFSICLSGDTTNSFVILLVLPKIMMLYGLCDPKDYDIMWSYRCLSIFWRNCKMFVTVYKTTQCPNQDHQWYENFKSYLGYASAVCSYASATSWTRMLACASCLSNWIWQVTKRVYRRWLKLVGWQGHVMVDVQ